MNEFHSPIGTLRIFATDRGLSRIVFANDSTEYSSEGGKLARQIEVQAARQLREYFSGRLQEFELPVDLSGTEFQLLTWKVLCGIKYGETISYAEVARRAKRANAARAIGNAISRNPIGIVVPCHRVIASDGSLGGFSGGIKVKESLLVHETKHLHLT